MSGFLFFFVVIAGILGGAPTQGSASAGTDVASPSCDCPATSSEWVVVPGTMDVPDEIVGRLDVRRMIACEHGVFFQFRAGRRQESRTWWLGLVPPTREQYRYCFEGEYERVALEAKLTAAVAEAKVRYRDFRREVPDFLGRRYREGKPITFRAYNRKPVLEGISVMTWRGKALEFRLIPNLYTSP